MALKIAQSDEWVQERRWRWEVWLEGTPAELDEIVEVKYLLHPTFKEPVRVIRDRKSAFRLRSAGWGEFTVRAEVTRKNGKVQTLRHNLKLHLPKQSTAMPKEPQVFISHSSIDGGRAGELTRALESRGVKVTSSASAAAGDVWRRSLESALADSHAIVALESDLPSRSLDWELATARNLNKPVYHLRFSDEPSSAPQEEQVVRVGSRASADTIADNLVSALQLKI